MVQPGVKIEGARELRKAARDIGGPEGRKAIRQSHKKIADVVTPTARRDVPVRNGKLKASIRPAGTLSKAEVRAGGARVPYAGPIHGGWPARNIAPNPFLTDAVSERYRDVIETLEAEYERLGRLLSTD